MDGKIDLFTLLSLIVAVVVILKLRSVLGRRTGDDEARIERQRQEELRRRAQQGAPGQDKVVTLPRRDRTEPGPTRLEPQASAAEAAERIKSLPNIAPDVAGALVEIVKVDTAFDPDGFLRGARQAYEMIVTAFAEGNRKTLKDLLSKDVFEGFIAAISEREARGEVIDQSFVGISKADIVEAELKNGVASVTVRFLSQLISATRDRAGVVVNGDPQKVKEVTDVWTFSRDISSARARSNPNWKLIATQAAA